MLSKIRLRMQGFATSSRGIDVKTNYYGALNLPKTAKESEIKEKYYELAKKYHPDNQENTSENIKFKNKQEFIKVSAAYEVLGD